VKFGKVTAEQLQRKYYAIDSNARAVVLSDIGDATIEGNSKGWFSINFTRHKVVHILNKSGYDQANVEVPLYTSGSVEETLENVKAVTYNLEGGKIVETKLDKASIFKEKVNRSKVVRKFTMPAVKDGSIIEFSYTVNSDFIWNLDAWYFQDNVPELWSEYRLSVPKFFSYAFLAHGYHPMYINDHSDRQGNFMVRDTRTAGATESASFTETVTDYRWVMKDIPEFKEESYTSAVKNHLSSMEFQLVAQNYPLTYHDYRGNWNSIMRSLLEADYFGAGLKSNNNWLGDDLKPVLAGSTSDLDKAQRIFTFVRDNFTSTGASGIFVEQKLKDVMKTRKGTVSEINMLLTAMLRFAGLKADPIILSTRDHGYAMEMYPMESSFNYTVSMITVDDKPYYLDASKARLPFGLLPAACYNGHARVVNEDALAVYLKPDSVRETSVTSVFVSNDDKGKWGGTFHQVAGQYQSFHIRNQVKESGKEAFFQAIQKQYGSDITIRPTGLDSLTQYEMPVAVNYEMALSAEKPDIIYINPMFQEGYKKNPFASAERSYPVEMPFTSDEVYLLTMEVPAGYVVDELPKALKVKLDDQGSGYFEYLVSQSGNTISLRSRLRISRTLFLPDEYDMLREFFKMVVNKHNEQIVFKKSK
jgi:Domain of Unknown Function with PDB structure (DUF3857)/Domain of Unknown Function with PDB structure (DUF3858)/Transglutaminase-like superfamily